MIQESSIANSNQPIINGMDGRGEDFFFISFLFFVHDEKVIILTSISAARNTFSVGYDTVLLVY